MKKLGMFNWILVVILSLGAVFPLFHSGFFPLHDNTQVQRVFEMNKALTDGMFPVRWVADLGYGYGYPIFNFYAPLAYYIGAFFQIIGFNALLATKLMIGLAFVLSAVSMYYCAKHLFGNLGGVVSSVFYIYAPYHALDLYVRGDISELYAYAFLPLLFYGIFLIYLAQRKKGLIFGAIGFAGIILSHNLSAMMFTPFAVVFGLIAIFLSTKNERLRYAKIVLLILILGICIAAFYWLPALYELKYTNVQSVIGGGSNFADHFVCPMQLWNSPWGFGGSAPGCVDGLSLRIGKVHILAAILAFILLIFSWFWKGKQKNSGINIFIFSFFLATLFSIFFTLSISKPVWEIIKPMAYFQFPWRFLFPISFFTSLLAGSIFFLIPKFSSINLLQKQITIFIIFVIIIFGVIFVNYKLFVPQQFLAVNSSNFINSTYLSFTTSKISDEYMPQQFIKPKDSSEIIKQKLIINSNIVKIISQQEKTQKLTYQYVASSSSTGIVNIAYFPAWKVFIDNTEILFTNTHQGLLINLPKGNHTLKVQFKSTNIEIISDIVSLASLVGLLLAIIVMRKKAL